MSQPSHQLVAGRLALDFANLSPTAHDLSWDEFVSFLEDARLISNDRATRLRPIPSTEPQAVDAVLLRILRLRESLRAIFASIVDGNSFPASWVEPVNEVLRVTEGHDELVPHKGSWSLQLSAGKADWTGFSLRLPVPPRSSWWKVPERLFAAVPIPCAGFFSTTPLVPAAGVGVPWRYVAIATKSPPSCVVALRATANSSLALRK